jgi:hypothetical protein
MFVRSPLGALVMVAALLPAACASPQELSEDPSQSAYGTLQGFCHLRAQAECSPAVVSACQSGSVDNCVSLREASCVASVPQGTRYVPNNAEVCVELVRDVYTAAALTRDEVRAISRLCEASVFTGPGGARAPCTSSLDCDTASGLECIPQADALEGKCLVPKMENGGMNCDGEADRCAEGLYCDGTTRVCLPAKPAGQACQLGTPESCQGGSECLGSGPMAPGSCFALAPAGAPCTSDDECADGLCDRPMANGNGSCTALLQMVSIAESCQGFRQ